MKYLAVNSDDLGMCHSINTAVVKAVREGILTQASLMAPCPWFEEAVALAREYDIPCGIHLVATCDWDRFRWRPLTGARSFVQADGVYSDSVQFVQEHADRGELEAEFIAQIELVLSRGIRPTHLDVHMGMMDPGIHAKLCRKYGLLMTHPQVGDMGRLHPEVMFSFDGPTVCYGDADAERKKREFCQWLRGLGDGYHYCAWHVGEASAELESLASRTHHGWQWTHPYRTSDLAVVCDPEVRGLCRELGIKLISLRDHPSAAGR
jgi:chitin disaccharide deacetylase